MNALMKSMSGAAAPYAIAGAIYFGITAMYLPWPTGDSAQPSSPDMGIPADEQPQQRKSCKSHSDCPSPQACVDGVCCLPAVKQRGSDEYQVRPYPGQPFPSRLYSAPHGLAMLGWYDSLRISK
jgi:hypothetical protein